MSGDVQVLFCIWKHGTVFVQICLCCIESMGSGPRYSFLAGKEQMLTEELVMRLAYLSGYEKAFNESLYRAMGHGM